MDSKNTPENAMNRRKFIEKSAVMSAFMIVPRFVLGGKGYTAPSDLITLGFIGTGKHAGGLQGAFFDTNETKILAASDVYGVKLKLFADQEIGRAHV